MSVTVPCWDGSDYEIHSSDAVPVDVLSEIEIARGREEVAAYAVDPDNATAWYRNIKAVDWESPRPLAVGSRIAFLAQFLGRRLAYTYEVREWVAGERFVMSTAQGPFPMEATYTWQDSAGEAPEWRCATAAARAVSPRSRHPRWPPRCGALTARICAASRRPSSNAQGR